MLELPDLYDNFVASKRRWSAGLQRLWSLQETPQGNYRFKFIRSILVLVKVKVLYRISFFSRIRD